MNAPAAGDGDDDDDAERDFFAVAADDDANDDGGDRDRENDDRWLLEGIDRVLLENRNWRGVPLPRLVRETLVNWRQATQNGDDALASECTRLLVELVERDEAYRIRFSVHFRRDLSRERRQYLQR